ncbi:hypothetical protein ACRAWG_13015 [Methylobacterium sp. P31]
MCRHFERPGIVALARRLVWARRALAALRTDLAGSAPPSRKPARP